MRRAVLSGVVLVVGIIALAAVAASLQKPTGPRSSTSIRSSYSGESTVPSAAGGGPMVVGVEYAQSGLAVPFAQLGVSGAKYLPASFTWDVMQRSNDSAINFAVMDAYVKEYQAAGFTQLVVGLKSQSHWASVDYSTDPTPKPEYRSAYQKWVGSIVERYDGDGIDDMPGLRFPVRYYEVGVEFSTYEPEPVGQYLQMLSLAYGAAHDAYSGATVLNAAFLVTTAFDSNPTPDQYAASFAAVDHRIMYHSLSDILQVLDRPDIFDAVDFHALGDAYEISSTVNWLNYEMSQRGYSKPIVIGDTAPSPLASWGPATVCNQSPSQMGIMVLPATEADRCRVAAFFRDLIGGNQTDLAWTYSFVASDMVEKIVVAADSNVTLIDASFMEDLPLMTSLLFQAGAGLAAWGGMAATTTNAFTQVHTVQSLRPSFYAVQQLMAHISNYTSIRRIATNDSSVYLYKMMKDGKPLWIVWYGPGVLSLPGDTAPSKTIQVQVGASAVDIEPMISQLGQTRPNATTASTEGGVLTLTTGASPTFVYPTG